MSVRALGVLLLLFCGFLVGAWLVARSRGAAARVAAARTLIGEIRRGIERLSLPFSGILRALSSTALSECGVAEEKRQSLPALLLAVAEGVPAGPREALEALAEHLSGEGREGQIRRLEGAERQLEEWQGRYQSERGKEERLLLLLPPLLVGILLFLFL